MGRMGFEPVKHRQAELERAGLEGAGARVSLVLDETSKPRLVQTIPDTDTPVGKPGNC